MRELTDILSKLLGVVSAFVQAAPAMMKWLAAVFVVLVLCRLIRDQWKARKAEVKGQDLAYVLFGLAAILWGLGR